jgi:tRNA1(Val) A37 N6-methylase TrmN6
VSAGIVRPPRRPPGWCPPGPLPRGRPDLVPQAGEDLCFLGGNWRIFQRRDGHRWSLDDLVTAWFAAEQMGEQVPRRIADLGCGIGAVLMLLAWRFPDARLVGVEAQAVSLDLARRSLAWNGIEGRCEVRLGDLRDTDAFEPGETFDLVTATPPYLRPGEAIESRRVQWGPCHFEHRGGVDDYCAAASRLLAPGGRFVTCAGAMQDERVACAAAASGLAILRRRDVVPREGSADDVGPIVVEPELVVRTVDGQWTPVFRGVRAAMGMPSVPR